MPLLYVQYELEREDLVDELESLLELTYPPARDWFAGEDDEDQDEFLEQLARYQWCYPQATRTDALQWLADEITAYYKENVEIARDGRG